MICWLTILECGTRVRTRALAGLTDQQIETLKSLLRIVRDNLSAEVSVEETD